MKEYTKVPLDRIEAIIGPNGDIKKLIEEKSGTVLNINTQTGDVEIDINDQVKDLNGHVKGLRTKDVVNAIAGGFDPDHRVFRLLNNDLLMFETIILSDKTETSLKRMKGRIIGGTGGGRKAFEDITGVHISVHGNTVGLIGFPECNKAARWGITMLIKGLAPKMVYNMLEKRIDKVNFPHLKTGVQ